MDLLALKKDLPAIEDGRWVDKTELPALLDMRVKVKGYGSKAVQDAAAARKRALPPEDVKDGKPTDEAYSRLGLIILQDVLVDIEGLTQDGKPVPVEEVRAALTDPAYEPLADLILRAAHLVNESRVAKREALAKN